MTPSRTFFSNDRAHAAVRMRPGIVLVAFASLTSRIMKGGKPAVCRCASTAARHARLSASATSPASFTYSSEGSRHMV